MPSTMFSSATENQVALFCIFGLIIVGLEMKQPWNESRKRKGKRKEKKLTMIRLNSKFNGHLTKKSLIVSRLLLAYTWGVPLKYTGVPLLFCYSIGVPLIISLVLMYLMLLSVISPINRELSYTHKISSNTTPKPNT